MNTAFICFFPVYPTNMGSAEVIRSLFINWPGKKKIFQISHLNKINNNTIYSYKIFYEHPLLKILAIPFLIFNALFFLKKNKFIVIEGASWIGYSFITLVFFKIFSRKTKIIYHSHSIEYEVRKMFSNPLISLITKILEKFVFILSDVATTVSEIERRKIYKLYKVKTTILENGISSKRLKIKSYKKKNKFLFFCGSYKYLPNKLAIDFIIKNLMPKIIKKKPHIKLVITGGGYNKNHNFLINLGIIPKSKMLGLILNSICLVVPINLGTGTRIKILEALLIGANVVSTPVGSQGIKYLKDKNLNSNYIIANKNKFFHYINYFITKEIRKNHLCKKFYRDLYLMENIVKRFFLNKNVNKIIKISSI